MNLIEEEGGLAQVESETNKLEIEKDKFKERIVNGMKENLILSVISFLWNKILDDIESSDSGKNTMQKDFINLWKTNIHTITQEQLKAINSILNDSNLDMINIITGKKGAADVEDYQQIINESIREIEKIFWKMCGK